MIVRCAARSETGRARESNEDAFALHGVVGRSGSAAFRATTESEMFRRFGLLLAVADGMRGSGGGAEASRIVLTRFSEFYYARPRGGCDAEEFVGELRECAWGAVDARGACSVDVAPEATWVAGERSVLGTDGWHGSSRGLPWDGVVPSMRDAATPEAACEEMVAGAVQVDGSDNATALVLWLEE